MNNLLGGWLLAAGGEMDRIAGLGGNFRGERAELGLDKVCLIGAFFVGLCFIVWLVARLFDDQQPKRPFYSRRKLWRALCRGHQLSRSERKLLSILSKRNRLKDPAILFLRPELFDLNHTEIAGDRKAAATAALKAKLFAGFFVDGRPVSAEAAQEMAEAAR
ncbi:MAG: hypothetical protein AB7O62_10460 [Pirellulales bacterium]